MSKPLDAQTSSSFAGGPSFGLGNRLIRLIWGIVWAVAASWTHPLHGWRRLLLRSFGAKVGRGVYVAPSAKIWLPSNLELDDFSAIGEDADLYCMGRIYVGKYAIVSKGAHLCAGTHDFNDKYFQLITRDIFIEDYAWVAADAFVAPGVRVGEGAVLGACAVATKNLENWTVYGGNPARPLKSRTVHKRDDAPKPQWKKHLEGRG